ncbi:MULTISPECIES: hypothetical protein [Bradyrhizobium]|nr:MULTISPECIES: hypothetical protein [Bradyrhizobium]
MSIAAPATDGLARTPRRIDPPPAAPLYPRMNDPSSPAGPVATAMRYLSTIVGCACLLLAAICIAIACQVFIQTGVFAQSYAMVGLIGTALGCLTLTLARVWK